MKTQNSNKVEKNQNSNTGNTNSKVTGAGTGNPVAEKGNPVAGAGRKETSNYSKFLNSYKKSKVLDGVEKSFHLVAVANFLNAHNREFSQVAPIKKWLTVLKSEGFNPRVTKKGYYSLFYTLQSIMKELKDK